MGVMKKDILLSPAPSSADGVQLSMIETAVCASPIREGRGTGNNRFVAGDKFFNYEQFGALRDGGEVRLFSKSYFGLLVATLLSAFVYAMLRYCIRPALMNFLELNRKETRSVMECLLSLPTSFSFFVGLLSDVAPIYGYRRKSYIILGSFLSFATLMGMTILSGTVDPTRLSEDEKGNMLVYYMVLIMGTTMGTLFVKIATDARIVELSQREPLTTRGKIQINYLIFRTLIECIAVWLATLIVEYDAAKGNLHLRLSPFWIFAGLAFLCMITIPFVMLNCFEMTVQQLRTDQLASLAAAGLPASNLQSGALNQVRSFVRMCEQRAVWQLVLFLSLLLATTRFFFGAANRALSILADLDSDTSLRSTAIRFMVTIVLMFCWKLSWSNSSWRRCVSSGIFLLVLFEVTRALLILYVPETRNQVTYDAFGCLMGISSGIFTIFSFIPATEIAELGAEGATVGLLASFRSILAIAVRTLSDQAFANVAAVKILNEDYRNIGVICALLMISYGVHALGFFSVLLLPRQKLDAQQLRVYGGYSRMACGLLVLTFLSFFTFAFTLNVRAIIDMANGTNSS